MYTVPSYHDCTRCELSKYRNHIIFGNGNIPADILFIGDAPMKADDTIGLPFVGPIGVMLKEGITKATLLAGMNESPSCFFTNLIACRPTDKTGEIVEPSKEEINTCLPRLLQTVLDVKPKHVVLLGAVAKRYLQKDFPTATCLLHPAFILRKGGISHPLFLQFARDLSVPFKEVSQ